MMNPENLINLLQKASVLRTIAGAKKLKKESNKMHFKKAFN